MSLYCLYVSLDVIGTLGCLELRFLHQKYDFCTSGLMNARLSVHCTLKRAIGSVSGHLHAHGTLKRTGKRPARLQHAYSTLKPIAFLTACLENLLCGPECRSVLLIAVRSPFLAIL